MTYSWAAPARPERPERTKFKQFAFRAAELAGLPVEKDWIFNIVFLDDRKMAAANAEYVGHEGTTDVITFSYLDDAESLFPGDLGLELLISADVAFREGERRKNRSLNHELALYIVHGVLHAAGYDDLSPVPRARMRVAERRLLKKLNAEFQLLELWS